jgi:small-conductance mechanosensitive channel
VKIDVRIRIMENDYEIEGTISDIGLFFGTLKTSSTEYISIPNSVSLSKMIDTNRMNKRAYLLLLLGL